MATSQVSDFFWKTRTCRLNYHTGKNRIMPQRQGSPVDALALQSWPWEQKERTGSLEEDLHGTTGGVRQKQVSEVVWVVPSLMLAVEPPEGVGFKVPWSLRSNVAWSFLALGKKEKKRSSQRLMGPDYSLSCLNSMKGRPRYLRSILLPICDRKSRFHLAWLGKWGGVPRHPSGMD